MFIYLKINLELGLWYPKDKDFNLTTYIDADWADSIDDRKSTNGGAFCLGKCLESWLSKIKKHPHHYLQQRNNTLLLHLATHKFFG